MPAYTRGLAVTCLAVLTAASLGAQAPSTDLIPLLHSVSYAGVWRGQARLEVDAFLLKAKELGFSYVELVGKRPHVSPLDYDAAARQKLRARMQEPGLTLACIASYPDFTAGVEKPGIPAARPNSVSSSHGRGDGHPGLHPPLAGARPRLGSRPRRPGEGLPAARRSPAVIRARFASPAPSGTAQARPGARARPAP